MKLIEQAVREGRSSLSEYESKQLLSHFGIPVTREVLIHDIKELGAAAREIGYPLVLKGCSPDVRHKSEKGLIRMDIRNDREAERAFEEIVRTMNGQAGSILIQEMIRGQRELVVGLIRDPQFGPCVMFGLGGIFTEILKDVSFRMAPLEKKDALEMMKEIKGRRILEAVRGLEPVDLDALVDILISVGRIGLEHDAIKEIDLNPVIISGTRPIVVDALVILN
ncbi:MAG: acetate--CoA ligase family protein [Deltaproteobacteria bacterium]|nr:acetate--CoA ligase family protein [Deltaproteobacteria bacterium]